MPALSVTFKTVSSDCNLDCSYCYFRVSLEGERVRRRIDMRMLEKFIPKYMAYVADIGIASMGWQGGEPTLAGLQFFEDVVALQAAHARPGTTISNSLQTNGVLLDDAWGAFLRTYNFLVGISIDGPQEIHDSLRRNRGGRGTFNEVMRGVDVLRRNGVGFNVLCVVGPHNVGRAGEVLSFFERNGFSHVQFIPAMDFQATEPTKPATYLISPKEYGGFLRTAFDLWYADGAPTISIRIFDNFLQSYLGLGNELCVHSNRCEAGIFVEYDGSAYPCDFYIAPRWKLGNVADDPLREIAVGAARTAFIAQKAPLPEDCQSCEWLAVCKSGCPRNRVGDELSALPEYFSPAYKDFFTYADERLKLLRDALMNRARYLRASLPQAAAGTCPCGNGRAAAQCCERSALTSSYVFRQ